MAYSNIVNVSISLDVATVSRLGFGTSLFISDHVWFTERSRSYTNIDDAAVDLPVDSDAYQALVQAFSADISPSVVKIGRRSVDTATFTPGAITASGQTVAITVVGTDDSINVATFTSSTGSETPTDVITDLTADLGSIAGVTIAGTATLVLSKSGSDDYAVTSVVNMTHSTITTETASAVMAAIVAADDDFYFVATNDHTDAFIMAMAADVEARTKIYFVTSQDVLDLGVYSTSATDTFSKLKQNSYFRTTAWFHHEADTKFPEMNYISIASPSDPGKKIWANNRVTGSSAAQDPATSQVLTTTQKSNLNDKNANYTEVVGGVTITRRGTVSGNATFLISLIRNRDFLEARLNENFQTFLINKPVVPYTDAGIGSVENTLTSTLDRYVETETQPNILQQNEPYTVAFPRRKDVSFSDVANGIFTGSFVAYLSGAIREIKITGSLTYQTQS